MDDQLRVSGAVAAAGLSGLVAIAALAIGHLEIVVIGAALGVPVGAVLGFGNAPRIARQSAAAAFASALVVAATAVVLGDLIVWIGWVLLAMLAAVDGSNPMAEPVAIVAGVLALPVVGMLFLGLPAFALAFGVTWPWTFVIRWLGRGPARAEPRRRPDRSLGAR
jgi:hypothetical protein